MKLDLTHEQRNALELASDVIADLIEDKTQTKEDLLSKTYEYQGPYLLHLNEQIAELNSDIRELAECKHYMKRLTS